MSDKITRMKPEARRENILAVAMDVAIKHGYDKVTRERVATQAGISTGLVNHAYGTMGQLQRAVMRAAIQREILPIVSYGLGIGCKHAHSASNELKYKAMEWSISNGGESTGE